MRDEHWGTCIPQIFNLDLKNHRNGFRISYNAKCENGHQTLSYEAMIEGAADGSLEFQVKGVSESGFLTSRAGFVVLHPLNGVAGCPVSVTHVDGSIEHSVFPKQIKPSQPFFDIRALSHQVAPGLSVTCTMEGDAFEMEDHRNWTDASYKTYIRPLSKPHPYTLEAGKLFDQRVVLSVEGSAPLVALEETDSVVKVSIENELVGRLPEFALALHPDYAEDSFAVARSIKQAQVKYLFCSFDASLGHGAHEMLQFKRAGEETGTLLILEAVLPLRDDSGEYTDDLAVLTADIDVIKEAVDEAGVDFAMISPSPACYHNSYQSNGDWPLAPPLKKVYELVRQAFPLAMLAGGMHSYFTELNRLRPPVGSIDVVTHSSCPIVHASDDVSVMETLEALPWVFGAVRELVSEKPYWIGPTAIGMRFNPYAARTEANPNNVRGAMVDMDPRQRGLFNAAWSLGYIAQAVVGRVSGLCLSSIVGAAGVAWQKMAFEQPWFDQQDTNTAVFPVYHVIAGLAPKAGVKVRKVNYPTSPGVPITALAFDHEGELEIWLGNTSSNNHTLDLPNVGPEATIQRLDTSTFELCCSNPEGFSSTRTPLTSARLTLGPYAVIRVRMA